MKFRFFLLLGLVLSGESFPQVLQNKKDHNSNEIQLIEQILKTENKTQLVTKTDQNDEKLSEEIIDSLIGCGIFSVTTAGLVYLGPAAVGFRSLGVAKNSIMAAIQSFYGNIAKHSWFAAVQSWTYRSGGAALLQTSAATGALTGSSCLVIFSEFWEALPEEYFGDEAMEIYKQFAVEKADDIKDFTIDVAEEIGEGWNDITDRIGEGWNEDVVPELEEFYENTKNHTVRITRKVGTKTKSFYNKTIDKTVEISENVAKGTKKVYKKAMNSKFMNNTKSVGQDISMETKKLWSKVAGGTSSAGKKGYDYGVIAVTAVGGYFGNIFG